MFFFNKNKRANGQNDRDEIRRKLAIVSSSSLASSHIDLNQDIMISDYMRRPSLVKNTSGQNLQICFMNEMADDLGEETIPDENSFESPEMANSISSFSMLSINSSDSCDTFLSQLQHETKQALAKVSNSVKSKIQSESASKKPSPIADIVREQFSFLFFLKRKLKLIKKKVFKSQDKFLINILI